MEKERSFDILDLHTYKVKLTGDRELTIALPYIKTSAISAILFGSATEFREIIKEYISPESIKIDVDEMKMKVIAKALDILNRDFSMKMVDQVTDILNIALTEYDQEGKITKQGNCAMFLPEDIKPIIEVLIYDLSEVIKNVFGVGVKKTRLSSRKKERTEDEEKKEKTDQELL